jgi:hypothetical protein
MPDNASDQAAIETIHGRTNVLTLLATNPNYFGTLPGLGFEPVAEKQLDTTYERLTCVSFSPERDRLEATVQLRQTSGYSGGLCTPGSFEHVRFYVSYDGGTSWDDAGMASINVHDLPAGKSCDGTTWPPLSYVCGVAYAPRRNWCAFPVLPLVRAVLSWQVVPDPNSPDQKPIWGDVRDCRIQVRPRPFIIFDVLAQLPKDLVKQLPPHVLAEAPSPDPDPAPQAPVPLAELATLYRRAPGGAIPPHRFTLPHLEASASGPANATAFVGPALEAAAAKLDLSAILAELDKTSGDTSYEELECVGLDNNTDQLVGTFRVKRSSGYSGGPCTAGSTEYVAYWADFGTDCRFTYLGTATVRTHDYSTLPDGGLCYAAPLAVDLGALRRSCDTPVIGRVRAVLSWGTPSSTTDPDAIPYWGNRLDVHVQLRPGNPYDGTARFDIVGGVPASSVNTASGLTLPGASLAVNGSPLPYPDCPFAGTVTFHGPLDPVLAGHSYRIRVRNLTVGGTVTDLIEQFFVVDWLGNGSWVTPGAGGWTAWPSWSTNTTGKLGHFNPGGNDQWEVQLELAGVGVVDVRRVQADNTLNASLVAGDLNNRGYLQLSTAGACRVAPGPVAGTFIARDTHFAAWSIVVDGGPGGPIPPTPLSLTPPLATGQQTSVAGQAFTVDLSALQPCGYVVRLGITDRAVVNSATTGRTVFIERGICLD